MQSRNPPSRQGIMSLPAAMSPAAGPPSRSRSPRRSTAPAANGICEDANGVKGEQQQEQVRHHESTSCTRPSSATEEALCLQALTRCDRWNAWLQCQPRGLMHGYNPQSWTYWHQKWWAEFLAQTDDLYWEKWTTEEWVHWESSHGIEVQKAAVEGCASG